jgi:hypothetical protein
MVWGFGLALQGGGTRFAVGLQGVFRGIGQTHLIFAVDWSNSLLTKAIPHLPIGFELQSRRRGELP